MNNDDIVVLKYPFGYDIHSRQYYGFNICERTQFDEPFEFNHITVKDFTIWPVNDQDQVYKKMIPEVASAKLEDWGLPQEERALLVSNIVRFTNEFWSFADKFKESGNKIEIYMEPGEWDADEIHKVMFNGKQVFCPTENYLNIVDYMIKEGFELVGVEVNSVGEPVTVDTPESKRALLKIEIAKDVKVIEGAEFRLAIRKKDLDEKNALLSKLEKVISGN